jgi:nitroreductase
MDIDLAAADHLLTTTKQVRRRLDLTRPVPRELLLECIDIASHAPMGGNLERNRWVLVEAPDTKAQIGRFYAEVGTPYLAANEAGDIDDRTRRVIDSARFLVEHLAEAPVLVIAARLDRPPTGDDGGTLAGYFGSVIPGVWSFQLAARARGLGSAWTTFHLGREREVAELLAIPEQVTQVALLPVAYYTGEDFTPAPRRPAREITYLNRWKAPVD